MLLLIFIAFYIGFVWVFALRYFKLNRIKINAQKSKKTLDSILKKQKERRVKRNHFE